MLQKSKPEQSPAENKVPLTFRATDFPDLEGVDHVDNYASAESRGKYFAGYCLLGVDSDGSEYILATGITDEEFARRLGEEWLKTADQTRTPRNGHFAPASFRIVPPGEDIDLHDEPPEQSDSRDGARGDTPPVFRLTKIFRNHQDTTADAKSSESNERSDN